MAGDDRRQLRYYAFSPEIGRRRAGAAVCKDEATVIAWARSIGADNLTTEDGPPSKPFGAKVIWERNPRTPKTITVWDADGNPYTVAASALTPA